MMTLPPEVDQCLHKHTRYILQNMAPDGVYVYMSGAKLLDQDDHQQFSWAHDTYGKNHAVLKIVAKHGLKGFEAFLEALATTRQTEIVERLTATLEEKNSKVTNFETIGKIRNTGDMVASTTKQTPGPSSTSGSSSSGVYIVGPSTTASTSFSPRPSRRQSLTRTPLTPPLSEDELDEHLTRLKSLLRKISTSHGDRHCRQEAKDLLGELDEAGEAMMDRVRQVSEENVEKERELRRAKFMVRGMETEIERLKTSTSGPPVSSTSRGKFSSPASDSDRNGKSHKSKLCDIL